MRKITKFFINPIVKNLLLSVLVLIIGALCSALGGWDSKTDINFIPKVITLCITSFLYIGILIFYSTFETNMNKINRLLTNQNKAFEDIMIGIISICKQSATDISTTIHNITTSGKIDLQIWSFDKASNWVCKEIYSFLCDLSGKKKAFGVGYVRLVETQKPEIEIYMSAYANQNMRKPKIFWKKRKIDDPNGYHDTELFKKCSSDIEILIGHEKIYDTFSYDSKESKLKNKKKYNQYIAIPVFCDDTKMVGLLEVVCLNDVSLADTEEELEELASKFLVPYSYLLLLLHKLEKVLLAVPQK